MMGSSSLDAARRPFEPASSTASPSPPISSSASPTTSWLNFGAFADQTTTPLSMADSAESSSSPRRDGQRAPRADNRTRTWGQYERIEESIGEDDDNDDEKKKEMGIDEPSDPIDRNGKKALNPKGGENGMTLAVSGARSPRSVTPMFPAMVQATAGETRQVLVPTQTKAACNTGTNIASPSAAPPIDLVIAKSSPNKSGAAPLNDDRAERIGLDTVTPAHASTRSPKKPSPPRNLPQALSPSVTESLPPVVRTASNSSVTIQHPTPDLNTRSGAYVSNIAVLEATAERLSSTTSSIEEAIRWELNELKRSDSQRSSMLRARLASETSLTGSVPPPTLSTASRQSSIIGINTAARLGGYSPAAYVMSPADSFSNASTRLRSASKTSSAGVQSAMVGNVEFSTAVATIGEENPAQFPSMSRWDHRRPSLCSAHNTLPGKHSLAEMEPTSLTREVLDKADRATADNEGREDDEIIRAISQHLGLDSASVCHAPLASAPQHAPQFDKRQQQQPHYEERSPLKRPATSGSGSTSRQARDAFMDFDGVHWNPDMPDFSRLTAPSSRTSEEQEAAAAASEPMAGHTPMARPRPDPPTARPSSYFDPSNGHQMLYYPARVPAVLNLPPKLSKNSRNSMTAGALANSKRRSQVLGATVDADFGQTQDATRESWLPGPLKHLSEHKSSGYPAIDPGDAWTSGGAGAGASLLSAVSHKLSNLNLDDANRPTCSNETTTSQQPQLRRPARLTAKHGTRDLSALQGLPPQLRASAFFDIPRVEQRRIGIKDGSATRTLDSILDASAVAPVNAFTDHAFAGKLGREVYGPEKPRSKEAEKKAQAKSTPSPPAGLNKLTKRSPRNVLSSSQTHKKQASLLSLLNPKALGEDEVNGQTASGEEEDNCSQDCSQDVDQDQSEPGKDEHMHEGIHKDAVGHDGLYQGAPTTLLAELSLRKQEQKLRTRPLQQAYPNGLHSTLLDLDAVHEQQQKDRKARRVNLAWEQPATVEEDSDDDEVPLAMLAAAKAGAASGNKVSTMDISAVVDRVNRPPGLMARRDQEDNEPLSLRRERLQGRQAGPAAINMTMLQAQMITLNPAHGKSQSRLSLPLQVKAGGSAAVSTVDEDSDELEIPGETLAVRRQRLAAENPLPRARPVSGSFSVELLSQFGGTDEEKRTNGNAATGRASLNAPVPEEEETLGQRRRRLQAEREAREREMGSSSCPALHQARSMHNAGRASMVIDPRLGMADKFSAHIASLRAQKSHVLSRPGVGAHPGGLMGGRLNDSSLTWQQQRAPSMNGPVEGGLAYTHRLTSATHGVYGGSMVPPSFQAYGNMVYAGMGYSPQAMPGIVRPGHADRVESWRQSVLP